MWLYRVKKDLHTQKAITVDFSVGCFLFKKMQKCKSKLLKYYIPTMNAKAIHPIVEALHLNQSKGEA